MDDQIRPRRSSKLTIRAFCGPKITDVLEEIQAGSPETVTEGAYLTSCSHKLRGAVCVDPEDGFMLSVPSPKTAGETETVYFSDARFPACYTEAVSNFTPGDKRSKLYLSMSYRTTSLHTSQTTEAKVYGYLAWEESHDRVMLTIEQRINTKVPNHKDDMFLARTDDDSIDVEFMSEEQYKKNTLVACSPRATPRRSLFPRSPLSPIQTR